jgi:hypothetical protein
MAFSHHVRRDPCRRCGSRRRLTAHHVVPLRVLRSLGASLGVQFDVRNGMSLCRGCHAAHEAGGARLKPEVLSAENVGFADELGLRGVLTAEYEAAG